MNPRLATSIGFLKGKSRGGSGGLSSLLFNRERFRLKFHLLGTQVESDSLGSTIFQTPNAIQKTTRLIPFFQLDYLLSKKSLLKSSFYGDYSSIRYEDPDTSFLSQDVSKQWGIESVLIVSHFTRDCICKLGFAIEIVSDANRSDCKNS